MFDIPYAYENGIDNVLLFSEFNYASFEFLRRATIAILSNKFSEIPILYSISFSHVFYVPFIPAANFHFILHTKKFIIHCKRCENSVDESNGDGWIYAR